MATLQLPPGWYWVLTMDDQRAHWFGYVDGARIVVKEEHACPGKFASQCVIIHRGETTASADAANEVRSLLLAAGYKSLTGTSASLIWEGDGPPPIVTANRPTPPFCQPMQGNHGFLFPAIR